MDPFVTLGIARSFDVDLAAVEKVHRELSRALHPDRYLGASATERRAALSKAVEVNEAWRIVRDPIRRAEALLALRGLKVGEDGRGPKPDPEFLMEMLEQREALSEAKAAQDLTGAMRMAGAIELRMAEVERSMSQAFASESAPLEELAVQVGKLRFYRRFLDEVSAIEDELAG